MKSQAEIRELFDKMIDSLAQADVETFFSLIHEDAVIVDEDLPVPCSKEEFKEHLGWHASGIWDSFSWIPRQVDVAVIGNVAIISGTATFRGKPNDGAFRQRHLLFTQTWSEVDGRWLLVSWHLSPILGHVLGASPN